MSLADDVEVAVAGRPGVVAVGVGAELLPALLSARRHTKGSRWRVACPPDVVDDLGRAFPLGTAVAEACARGAIALRAESDSRSARTVFATAGRVDAVAGPSGDRTLVTDVDPARTRGASEAVAARFAAATPAAVRMPPRRRLVETARDALGDRFADDLAGVLGSLDAGSGALDRSEPVDDRTLLVALAARNDHLFHDVREWADEVGIAPKQEFTAERRALVDRGVVESIKVPMGVGRPNYRLRAVAEPIDHADPGELLSALRAQFAATSDGSNAAESRGDDRFSRDRRR